MINNANPNLRVNAVTFVLMRPSGEILMQLRDANSKRYPNMWCFPGGTVEREDANPKETVIREAREEYELMIGNDDCREFLEHVKSYGSLNKVFLCNIKSNQIAVLHEGAKMEWMTLDKIKNIELGFEQDLIVQKLEEFFANKSCKQ